MHISKKQSEQAKTLLASLGAAVLEVYLSGGYMSKSEVLEAIETRGLDSVYKLLAASGIDDVVNGED